jgi:hypothetical protein
VSIEPGLKTIPSPLIRCKSVAEGRVIAALMVIGPLAASPMVSVPAVMRSSSASVRPSVSSMPLNTSEPPKSIRVPAVRGRSTTALAPASITVVEVSVIESARSVILDVPAAPIT